jgi:putative ABC transport system substrate-binding protein
MGSPLQRRSFIALLGSAALNRPHSACAQQPALPTIGFLDSSAGTVAKLAAFYAGLRTEGFVKDQNVTIEYAAAADDYSRLPALTVGFVNRKVAVIAAAGVPAALAAKTATATIPIVFAVGADPTQLGLVDNSDRPGGHLTGVIDVVAGRERKLLQLLHELIPGPAAFAFLVNPANSAAERQASDAMAGAREMGLQVNVLYAKAEDDFDAVFAEVSDMQAGGLALGEDDLFFTRSAQLAALAARRGVPAISQYREFVAAGGLMSYGSNVAEIYHQVGAYSGLILKGASVADLPVYQSTRAEFVVNLKTAKSLGLTFPSALLGLADEVIQ